MFHFEHIFNNQHQHIFISNMDSIQSFFVQLQFCRSYGIGCSETRCCYGVFKCLLSIFINRQGITNTLCIKYIFRKQVGLYCRVKRAVIRSFMMPSLKLVITFIISIGMWFFLSNLIQFDVYVTLFYNDVDCLQMWRVYLGLVLMCSHSFFMCSDSFLCK